MPNSEFSKAVRGVCATVAGLAAWLSGAGSQASPRDLELAIEATYIRNLAHFITWPQGIFPNPTAPITLCVQGVDPFGPTLDQLTAQRHIDGRPFVVRRMPRLDPASGCQIAYLGGGPSQSPAQALEAVGKSPVVTVTDDRRGPSPHGIIHFIQDGPRLRFDADALQADESGVAISSKVLALAVTVKR